MKTAEKRLKKDNISYNFAGRVKKKYGKNMCNFSKL